MSKIKTVKRTTSALLPIVAVWAAGVVAIDLVIVVARVFH